MLLKQFRSFYARNYPNDMERQIAYFSIFGGLEWQIDTDIDLSRLICDVILENYGYLHNEIMSLFLDEAHISRLLHALAVGDRKIFTAFNKAGLNNGNGGAALNYLQTNNILEIETKQNLISSNISSNKKIKHQRISNKMRFTQPFLRFWFYFITPFAKEIEVGNYKNILQKFQQHKYNYMSLIFEELSQVMLNYYTRDEVILSLGSYWADGIEIDILATTKTDQIYIGECKWTNHKINKKELHKILEKCNKLNIKPSKIFFFSKRGFSKELSELQNKHLVLFSADSYSSLLKNISQNSLLPNKIAEI